MVSAYAQSSKLFEKNFLKSRTNVNPTIHRQGTDGETDANWLNRRTERPVSDAMRPDTVEMPKGYEVSMSQLTDEINSQASGFQENTPSQDSWNKSQRGFNTTKRRETAHLSSISRPRAPSRFQHLATPTRSPLQSICTNKTTRIVPNRHSAVKRKGDVRPWMKSNISNPKPQVPGFNRSTRRLSLSYTPLVQSKNSISSQNLNGEQSDSSPEYPNANDSHSHSISFQHSLVSTSQSSYQDSRPSAEVVAEQDFQNESPLQTKFDEMKVSNNSGGVPLEIIQAKEGALSDMKSEFAKLKAEILEIKSIQSRDLNEAKAVAITEMMEAKRAHSRQISEIYSTSICNLTKTKEETAKEVSTSVKCSIREIKEQAEEIKHETENNLKVSFENLRLSFLDSFLPFLQDKASSIMSSVLPRSVKQNVSNRDIERSIPFSSGEMRKIAETSRQQERLSMCQSNSTLTDVFKGYVMPPTPDDAGIKQSSGESELERRSRHFVRGYKVKSEMKTSDNGRGNPLDCVKLSYNSPAKISNPVTPQPTVSRKRDAPSLVGSAPIEHSSQPSTQKKAKSIHKGSKIKQIEIPVPIRRSKRIRKIKKIEAKTKPVTTVMAKRGRRPKKKTKTNKRESIIEDCFDFCGFGSFCNK